LTNKYYDSGVLPDDHPHQQLYWEVAPIWHDGDPEDLYSESGKRYTCGFSDGFESGIVMALLKPEWAQGFYHKVRSYYLQTHTEEELESWNRSADETAREMPITQVMDP
jgi:hypothetical protein